MTRYVVIGAGAVGGVVGARLHQAGLDVVLIARGAHLEAIAKDGLRVVSPADDHTLAIPAVGHVAEVGWAPGDVALLAVKSHQSAEVLADLAMAASPDLPVVCLQNAIANEPMALRHFANVYGVMVGCPTGHLEPGVVQAWSSPVSGILDIGRWPAGADARCEAIAADLRSATFDSLVRPDIARWKNRKLISNLGNAIQAVCGREESDGVLRPLVRAEGEAALAAAGRDVASMAEDKDRRGNVLTLGHIDGQRRPGGSSWQSLHRATGGIESDFLNGEVVLLGRTHGVPTPANAVLQRMARELAAARRPPGSEPAAEVLAAIASMR